MITVLRVSTPIYWVAKKTFIFQTKPRHVTPQINQSRKNEHCSEGFNTHLWCFQRHRWENINFSSKPRHVTPQIDCLGKTSTVLTVSTHIYGVSQKIDGKMFIFRVNLGMWPLKSIVLEKQALFWGFQHTFIGFLKEIDGKTFIFRVNLGMWPLKSIVSKNEPCSEGFNTHF